MFAEDISEDFSEDGRYHFLLDFKVFLDILEIFAEDCFLMRSFRKFLPSGFLPLSRFQTSVFTCKSGAKWRQDLATGSRKRALTTHTPLIKGVEVHPLN